EQGDKPFARLNDNLSHVMSGRYNRFIDGPKLRPVQVLPLDKLFGGRGQKVRVSKMFHYEELLCVSGHSMFRKPADKLMLIRKFLFRDARVPVIETLTSLFFQDANPHFSFILPIPCLVLEGSAFLRSIHRFSAFHKG